MPYAPLTHGPLVAAMFLPIIFAAVVWTLVLKGFSLWYAARSGQKWWFLALLVINTVGILEIVYLIWFRPKNPGVAAAAPATDAHAS